MALSPEQIADKRSLAKKHRGVSYDARRDAFVAEMYTDGARKWLGAYPSAEAAFSAYTLARDAEPRSPGRRPVDGAFAKVWAAFREQCNGGDPAEYDVFVYDDQYYTFVRVTFRRVNGKQWAFYEFSSQCKTCGEAFYTLVSPATARGISRNCEEHRKAHRWSNKGAEPAAKAPQDLGEILNATAAGLALVCEEMPMADFIAAAQARVAPAVVDATAAEALLRETPLSELLVDGDVVVFDNGT